MEITENTNIEIVKETPVYKGFFEFKHFDLRYKRFDGTMSNIVKREIFFAKKAIVVLPYDPQKDEIVLVEQMRFGAALSGDKDYVMEAPAGVIDGDDTPEKTAHRELAEETGMTAKEIFHLYDYLPSPGVMTEHVWMFMAIVDASTAAKYAGLASENEDIKIHVVKYDEAIRMLNNNEIRNANTILALQYLMLNRGKLREKYTI